jgi:hypothetical protein
MGTLMLDHLWSNGAKGIFHSTAKIFIGGVAWAATLPLTLLHKELPGW